MPCMCVCVCVVGRHRGPLRNDNVVYRAPIQGYTDVFDELPFPQSQSCTPSSWPCLACLVSSRQFSATGQLRRFVRETTRGSHMRSPPSSCAHYGGGYTYKPVQPSYQNNTRTNDIKSYSNRRSVGIFAQIHPRRFLRRIHVPMTARGLYLRHYDPERNDKLVASR